MSEGTVRAAIRELIMEIAEDRGIDRGTVTDDALFIDEMGLDSMAVLEVVTTIEREFSVEVPDPELTHMISIAKCAQIFEEYLAEQRGH